MPFPSVDDFAARILGAQLVDVVNEFLVNDELPFAFRQRPADYSSLKHYVAEGLGIDPQDVIVVGSGKVGFSLDPNRYFRKFSAASDIDVLVTSAAWFDRLWIPLLGWHLPLWGTLAGEDWDVVRRRMEGIYQGWIWPDEPRVRVLGAASRREQNLRELSNRWFDTFRGLSRYREFASRTVDGRLYRSRNHALLYQMRSLRQIREKIRPRPGP